MAPNELTGTSDPQRDAPPEKVHTVLAEVERAALEARELSLGDLIAALSHEELCILMEKLPTNITGTQIQLPAPGTVQLALVGRGSQQQKNRQEEVRRLLAGYTLALELATHRLRTVHQEGAGALQENAVLRAQLGQLRTLTLQLLLLPQRCDANRDLPALPQALREIQNPRQLTIRQIAALLNVTEDELRQLNTSDDKLFRNHPAQAEVTDGHALVNFLDTTPQGREVLLRSFGEKAETDPTD